jgi:hypothetical protein
VIDGNRQRTLLDNRNWFAPLNGKRPVHYYGLGLPAIDGGELCAVSACGHPVLLLDP